MPSVGVVFKIYTKDNADPNEVAKRVEGIEPKPKGISVEEVAFGIKIIKAYFVYEDSETGSSSIESRIRQVEGVSEVEVEDETLI
ncbi:MAG: hypothetical protein ACP5RP_02355 [Candidatus Micrarchaeia archaeon]